MWPLSNIVNKLLNYRKVLSWTRVVVIVNLVGIHSVNINDREVKRVM